MDAYKLGWWAITDNDTVLVLERKSKLLKEYIHFNKENKTVNFHKYEFFFKGGGLTPQAAAEREKESEWIQTSCKYGSWAYNTLAVNQADLRLALEIADKLFGRREEE